VRDITIKPTLNPLEVILVEDYMTRMFPKVTHYTMTEGNDCIWVYYGQINMYFIFRDGKVVDVQID
jgi:hypothetical protein